MKECTQEDKKTAYNYVFYNISEAYLEPVFGPLSKLKNVRVYKQAFRGGKLLQKLFFLHWSAKLNAKIKLPFKSIWFPRICKQDFNDNKPICYVFAGGKYLTQDKCLLEYIKKQNPRNRAIVFCFDLISKKHWNMNHVKALSDYIVTYDEGEAAKYGAKHMDAVMYGALTDVTMPETFENDVYFLGFAKDRLPQILAAYDTLIEAGLKCKFVICGVPQEQQRSGEGLIYSLPISYIENLENIKNSRCILEIMQGGSNAPTLRTEEAHIYRRKLLTNNTNLVGQPYYDASHMRVFSECAAIDTAFAESEIDYSAFDDSFNYSPLKMIDFFEKLLEKE